jgi:hypothetical protein
VGFVFEIILQLLRVILALLFELFAGVALSWVFNGIGRVFAAIVQAFGTLRDAAQGRTAAPPPTSTRSLTTCAACGARVPRRKFCNNCGRRLQTGSRKLAPK